ncbi:MAG: FtsX-like permease family protein [Alphaproteobacteria bacterium]|nr:FtsX-like permease family protein [Alphaproteobacteria bacterium]
MNPLPLVWADLRARGAGILALVLLVAFAVAMGVAVSATERGLRRASADAARPFDLLVGMPGSPTQLVLAGVYLQPTALPLLPPETLPGLSREKGAAWVSPLGFGDSWRGSPIVGVAPELAIDGGRRPVAEGRNFEKLDEAVVGARVKAALGDTIEPSHGIGQDDDDGDAHVHHGTHYTVVGRMAPTGGPWDRAILVPIESVWAIHGFGTGHAAEPERIGAPWDADAPGVPAVAVNVRDVASAYVIRSKYRTGGTTAVFPAEVLAGLFATLGDVGAVLRVFAIAAQALVVASVLMVVLVAIAARRNLIAILRALGAPRIFVFLLVWSEVAAILVAAGAVGLALGLCLAQGVAAWADRSLGLALPGTLGSDEFLLALASAGAGLVAAVLPAASAYRRSVAEGLRSA